MKTYARAYRPKMKKGQMNLTEKAYSEHLAKLKLAGEIIDYSYEPETLRIGQDCRYTPDFRVVKGNSVHCLDPILNRSIEGQAEYVIEFHEVKGTRKGKMFSEDDALVKIKAAAEMHPYKFIMVWREKDGSWARREIN